VSNRENVNRSHNSNIQKTHCPHGHAYTAANTIYQHKPNTTSRKCRACQQRRDAQRPNRKAA
jgi:7-cyano-7-deazaguanine synthase in queuosine biosynthesis